MTTTLSRLFTGAIAAALVLGLGLVAPASAATTWSFTATAGATQIKALGTTISSDLTATSSVTATSAATDTNSTAAIKVAQLVSTGVVETRSERFATPQGVATRTTSRIAGVRLLGGAIRADALETVVTTYANDDGTSRATGGSKLVNLRIAGRKFPVTVRKNRFVSIPGVAAIALNYFSSAEKDGSRGTFASALSISLLERRGEAPRGARINVNPAMSVLTPAPDPDEGAVYGNAYGSQIKADAGNGTVRVESGPTALLRTPSGGSDGETLKNSTASVDAAGVLKVAAVESTSTSSKSDNGDMEVTTTSQIAGVNLLGGLVKADAITATAHGERIGGTYRGDMDLTFVDLEVAGQPIDVDVAPNTTINVANLGKVVINEQATAGPINRIRAVHIVLDTERAGLPVGATIELAVASTALTWGS
ncbi:hypothetical protein KUV85_00980 [Nocardioides panacisoli]|uniref:choice-of-anchor P family protein n=1 Tax=Nocardioides panacisoli TaxID=627624 RepID=UPI001C62A67D|nr:choice-of-anchor P family protein [Nocardioides panacisoli]QYJ04286.1 hypothetical protein KUV85_00980 [Nocardioides panacisoli]